MLRSFCTLVRYLVSVNLSWHRPALGSTDRLGSSNQQLPDPCPSQNRFPHAFLGVTVRPVSFMCWQTRSIAGTHSIHTLFLSRSVCGEGLLRNNLDRGQCMSPGRNKDKTVTIERNRRIMKRSLVAEYGVLGSCSGRYLKNDYRSISLC